MKKEKRKIFFLYYIILVAQPLYFIEQKQYIKRENVEKRRISQYQQDFSRFPNVSPLRIDIILKLYITYKNDNKTNN